MPAPLSLSPVLSRLDPDILFTPEHRLIRVFYGERRARRSAVPLINHIQEGLLILQRLGASLATQRAFCLHPLLQADEDLKSQHALVLESVATQEEGAWVLMLAMEYRNCANSYLSHHELSKEGVPLSPLPEVNQMLIADKVQNYRDFLFYHGKTHPNAQRLHRYFLDWLEGLGVPPGSAEYERLAKDLSEQRHVWLNPLPLNLVTTDQSESFRYFDSDETGLPIGQHPGAFGVQRKHHVHEGVDLYCPTGTPVHAVEGGMVVAVKPFTGPQVGMPWWQDTKVVMVEGATGVVAYGEVESHVVEGQRVQAGDMLGHVVQVLRENKGRPMSMLHLELHTHGARDCPEWPTPAERPATLLDPTPHLLDAV